MANIEDIREVIPQFEEKLFGVCLDGSLDQADRLRRLALGPNCAKTRNQGSWCMRSLGIVGVRPEVHTEHSLLRIPHGDEVLHELDIVIDPTYLQFATRKARRDLDNPNTFVGYRHELIGFMDRYGARERVLGLVQTPARHYQVATLLPVYRGW